MEQLKSEPTRLEQQAAQLFDDYAEAHREHAITRSTTSRAVMAAAFLGWDRGDNAGAAIFDEQMRKRDITTNLAEKTAKVRRTILRTALYDTGSTIRRCDTLEDALQLLIDTRPSA